MQPRQAREHRTFLIMPPSLRPLNLIPSRLRRIELFCLACIINAMRVFLLILMMLLQPVRGWTADVMGVRMATELASKNAAPTSAQQVNTTIIVATNDQSTLASTDFYHQPSPQMSVDCAGHAADAAIGSSPESDSHCGACAACQTCHSVAIANVSTAVAGLMIASNLQQMVPDLFASAPAALSQKPPIS